MADSLRPFSLLALSNVASTTITDVTVDGSEMVVTFSTPQLAANFPASQIVVNDGGGTHTWTNATQSGAFGVHYDLGGGGLVADPATYSLTSHPEVTNPSGPVVVV
jgi:hypothetical protein